MLQLWQIQQLEQNSARGRRDRVTKARQYLDLGPIKMQRLVFFRSWSYFFCFTLVLVQYVSFWHQICGPSVYRYVSLVATCDISISLMYQRSNNGNTRSLSWTNSFHFRIAQICLLPHTIWATFCTVCGEKKTLQCFFHRPEPFLIRAVTAHLYLWRIFSYTKKGIVLIDVLHLLSMLRSPTIWLKLTSVRNDKKYFEKAGIGKLEWCLHFSLYKEKQIC